MFSRIKQWFIRSVDYCVDEMVRRFSPVAGLCLFLLSVLSSPVFLFVRLFGGKIPATAGEDISK